MASIQRRGKPGKYTYRVRYTDDAGRERSKSFKRKTDADLFKTSVSHSLLAHTYIDPAAGKVTVRAYGEPWRINQVHLRPNSAGGLDRSLRLHIYPHLGDRPMAAIRPSDIAAWQRVLIKPDGPLSPASALSVRGHLSALFNAAIEDRVLLSNPVTSVKAPESVKTEIVPLTPENVLYIEDNILERYSAAIALVAGSGLRYSECFGLTVDRVDFLRRRVRVNRQLAGRERGGAPIFGPTKTPTSTRTIPLAGFTIAKLAAHLAKFPVGPHGLVFTSSRGGALTRGVFGKQWRPVAEHVGLDPGEGLHQIRHFYASALIADGRSVIEVQKRLGHKSAVETLDTYAHLWPDSEDGTRAAVERIFGVKQEEQPPASGASNA